MINRHRTTKFDSKIYFEPKDELEDILVDDTPSMDQEFVNSIRVRISDLKNQFEDNLLDEMLDEFLRGKRDNIELDLNIYEREKEIKNKMNITKIMFIMACVILELFLVEYMKLSFLKGLAKYMVGKLNNFTEIIYWAAINRGGNGDEEEDIVKNEEYYLNKFGRILAAELSVFVITGVCSNYGLSDDNFLNTVSDLTVDGEVDKSTSDMTGYFTSMASKMVGGFLSK